MTDETIITEIPLDNFVSESYAHYARETIMDRALPDARDGLKPVQRRILLSMVLMGLDHTSPHRKSARVVGDVLGKYHPHGDTSVYDAMVRLAQDFSMRHPLVDGQGNYGSADGDPAAAMRYTEARLAPLGELMLANLKEDTVDWRDNFDGSMQEPVVLPTRFPNLLVNGSSGIAVGMTVNILPHNLGEVCDALVYLAKNWKKRARISTADLMKFIPGPDLPTGGLLYRYRVTNSAGEEKKTDMITQAYETGSATLVVQAKADIRDIGGGKSEIVVVELPYQVQKNTILERIAAARDKFAGITDARDESDYKGMRVVFETARGVEPQEVLERLLTHTQMRSSYSYNAMALAHDEGRPIPRLLSLGEMLCQFLLHRLEVIVRRSRYELAKAESRLHIVEGLLKALSAIDEVIEIIRKSQTTDTARTNLMKKLALSEMQAQAILDMPLRRLAALERKKLDEESKELKARIKELRAILESEDRQLEVIITETDEIKAKFANPRRTVIIDSEEGHKASMTTADLVVPTEAQMVIVTQNGLQRVNAKGYKDSAQGGKVSSKAVDVPLARLAAQPTDTVMLISNQGRLWQANIGRLAQKASWDELGLERGERVISACLATPGQALVIATQQGSIKRVMVEDCLSRAEATWGQIIGLAAKDQVLVAGVGGEDAQVVLFTKGSAKTAPRALRFEANQVNPQATPSAKGVAAIKMLDDPLIGGALLLPPKLTGKTPKSPTDPFAGLFVAAITEKGHAKRVPLSEFPVQGRGGQGVQHLRPTAIGGSLIAGATVGREGDVVSVYSVKFRRFALALAELAQADRPGRGADLCAKYGEGGKLFGDDEIGGMVV